MNQCLRISVRYSHVTTILDCLRIILKSMFIIKFKFSRHQNNDKPILLVILNPFKSVRTVTVVYFGRKKSIVMILKLMILFKLLFSKYKNNYDNPSICQKIPCLLGPLATVICVVVSIIAIAVAAHKVS